MINTRIPPSDPSDEARERAFLFGINSRDSTGPHDGGNGAAGNRWTIEDSLKELARLARTAGILVTGQTHQNLRAPLPTSYMGLGKLEEIKEEMIHLDTRTLIVDDELSPGQQRIIERSLPDDFKLIDRTALILDIFAQHARTREGMLQVELAQNQYRLPRLTRMWTHLERQSGGRAGGVRGGVGLRGPGEMQIETDRRLMRKRIAVLKRELENVRSQRRHHRQKRKRSGIPVITLAGYTNAGKSSLMKALSSADVLVENKLCATLDPTTRRVLLPGGRSVLFTDTVGFINKLPPDLVAAFRATLEEIAESDLVLHVVDITHPKVDAQIAVVEKVLLEMGVSRRRMLTVWNKIDRAPEPADSSANGAGASNGAIKTSALSGRGIDELLEKIEQTLKRSLELVELVVPYSQGHILSEVHDRGSVEEIEHRQTGTYLKAHLPPELVRRLREFVAPR